MSLKARLFLSSVLLAMIPLTISGFVLFKFLDDEVIAARDVFRHDWLRSLAHRLSNNITQSAQGIRLGLETFELDQLGDAEIFGILQIIYGQRPYLNAIALYDQSGNRRVAPAYLTTAPNLQGSFAGHLALTERDLEALADSDLMTRASRDGLTFGQPVRISSSPTAQLPLVIKIQRDNKPIYFASALLSLTDASGASAAMEDFSKSLAQDSLTVFLVDSALNPITSDGPDAGNQLPSTIPKEIHSLLDGGGGGKIQYRKDEQEYILAWAPLDMADLRVITLQSSEVAYQSIQRPKRVVRYWMAVAIFIAAVLGLYYGWSLSTPIQELASGVLQIARGHLETRVPVRSRDEIGKLAETFNYMAGILETQQAEIGRQGEEIRTWNLELQKRVEERTRDLREAQGYLVHTQKLAAVAELGSGVAHELNNPLAGILGFTQIMLVQEQKQELEGSPSRNLPLLKRIEEQTLRCRQIVSHLLKFSQEQVDRGTFGPVDLVEVVTNVMKLFEGAFSSQNIRGEARFGEKATMTSGNRAQLLQAFLQVFSAVRAVIAPGGNFVVYSETRDHVVRIIVEGPIRNLGDTSSEPFQQHAQKDQAMAKGLELWLARKIFQEHQGSLEIEIPSDSSLTKLALLVTTLPGRKNTSASEPTFSKENSG